MQRCPHFSLRSAILLKDDYLTDRIIIASRYILNDCPIGYNSLLFILPLGALAHSAAIKLINAGAKINCALGHEATGDDKELFGIPLHATPMYIAAEHTKYLPTVCFLERKLAICYPEPSEEGRKLINKANWLNNSGLRFYMGAIFCKDFFLNKWEIPNEIISRLIKTYVKL